MNRRECLKRAGVLSAAAILVLYGSPSEAADPQPVTVLVAYHSDSGNTEKMAQAVAEGAKAVPGTSVVLKRVGEVSADDLLSADALIVGSPVYFGNMSGEVLERHLRHEPTRVSKSRIKRLRGLSQPQYRLRVGEVRVFYDVTREALEVLTIVTKAEAARWLAEHATPRAPSGLG
jgi:mRNA-degrading endonuclease RelE of RelBE toxin-antitoxin system